MTWRSGELSVSGLAVCCFVERVGVATLVGCNFVLVQYLLVRICFTWCDRTLSVGVQDGLSVSTQFGVLAESDVGCSGAGGSGSASCCCVPSLVAASPEIPGRRRKVYLCCSGARTSWTAKSGFQLLCGVLGCLGRVLVRHLTRKCTGW